MPSPFKYYLRELIIGKKKEHNTSDMGNNISVAGWKYALEHGVHFYT
jgi:hypothetical protein